MRILIVGKWSKELAVAKALAASGEARIISYAGGINPGMLKLGAEIVTGDEDDLDAVVSCSREKKADLVFVGTETALAAGAVDRLQGAGLAAIGPTALQARLESDKTFARSLLQEAGIPGNPEFRICRDRSQAARAIDEFDGRVAVKPGGLTEGLGVRISGDQLPTPGDALAYAEYVLAQGIGGLPYLIIEELLEGEEFTLQALVAGGELLPFPLVQDYKRLLEGDLGPNTGGMGSIAGRDGLLPFVDPGTREEALAIMRETVSELDRRCRTPYRGFLYGQFMITARGLRLIEYNVRPGDPEVLNCFAVMKGDLLEAFRCMAEDSLAAAIEGLSFAPKASVCKFLVPSGYPESPLDPFAMEVEEAALADGGIRVDYSCTLAGEGLYHPGPRGVALTAAGEDIPSAAVRIEEVIGVLVRSDCLYHRKDIGSARSLVLKTNNAVTFLSRARGE